MRAIFTKVMFIAAECAVAALLSGCGGEKNQQTLEEVTKKSIFSWEEEYMLPEMEGQVAYAMEALGCEAVYQQVPENADKEAVSDYLEQRAGKKQDVYYLTGASEWALEESGVSMMGKVKEAAGWNKDAEVKGRFKGIVWDIEPYLLADFKNNSEKYMDLFVENCVRAYHEAKKQGLLVIVCIPNFYDSMGLGEQMEDLVENGCDAIAVMNYDKSDETGQIETEARIARKYGKGIINIAELQKPGTHDLTENNTYYQDGLKAVEDSFNKLKSAYPETAIGFSIHYMKPALELLKEEDE